MSVIPLTEQSSDLVTKRYHVPPEFFGGPLDVGYYLQGQTATVAGGSGNQAAVQPAPVSSNKIDQEATVFERTATAGHAAGTSTETVGIRGNVKRVDLERAVVQLPATERLIFLLHDVESYDHAHIARTLGIAEQESQTGLHQAPNPLKPIDETRLRVLRAHGSRSCPATSL